MTQLTVGVLSQKDPMQRLLMTVAVRMMIPTANTSAASSKSELVSRP